MVSGVQAGSVTGNLHHVGSRQVFHCSGLGLPGKISSPPATMRTARTATHCMSPVTWLLLLTSQNLRLSQPGLAGGGSGSA